jgi:hypothetical protein
MDSRLCIQRNYGLNLDTLLDDSNKDALAEQILEGMRTFRTKQRESWIPLTKDYQSESYSNYIKSLGCLLKSAGIRKDSNEKIKGLFNISKNYDINCKKAEAMLIPLRTGLDTPLSHLLAFGSIVTGLVGLATAASFGGNTADYFHLSQKAVYTSACVGGMVGGIIGVLAPGLSLCGIDYAINKISGRSKKSKAALVQAQSDFITNIEAYIAK